MEARAFAELLVHIEALVEEGTFLFKFSELRTLYESCLYFFIPKKFMYKVRLKEQILSHFPKVQAQSNGKNVFLVFDNEMKQTMKQTANCSLEDDAIVLSKAARIICEDILFNFLLRVMKEYPKLL